MSAQELSLVEKNPVAEIEKTNNVIQALMKLPHYAKMGGDQVFAIVVKAQSLGMDPIYALNGGLYSIKGKIGMPAESMASMIREKGHSITKDKISNEKSCILHGRRADNGDTWTIKFTIEDAKRAGIYGNSWEKYPEAMCYNRAMSFLSRQLFPDIIKGAGYTMEELKEIAKSDSSKVMETIETVEVKNEIERVSTDQAIEIAEILEDCPKEYKEKITVAMAKNGVQKIAEWPVDAYYKFKPRALQVRAEYLAKCMQNTDELSLEEKTA